jgi:tetratricopeptide (TPR) repeat protein
MVCPKIASFAWGTALAVSLACTAAAQTADVPQRLHEAQQLRAHDHFAEARTVYQNLLRDLRKDDSDPRLEALVEDNLAVNEQDSGNYSAAETCFNHGLATLPTAPADDSVLVGLKTHLAELYIAEVRAEDAEPILRQTLAAVRHSAKPSPLALSVLSEDLAVTYIMRRKFIEPEGLLRESQWLIENEYGANDTRLVSSLLTYAGFLMAQKRFSEAVGPAERAWQLLTKSPVSIPKPYEASALSVLGVVYYHAGRMNEAEECARKAVELATNSLGAQHPRLGLYLRNYALILKTEGRKNEAKAVQKKADEIMEQHPSYTSGGYTVNVASLR